LKHKIYNQDVIEWAKEYNKNKFHALLCDPPYHLTSITKRFGKNNSTPAKYGNDGAFQRASKGFMGETWDGGDIAFQSETWEILGNHLYPGAFGVAFSAARNWHRMAIAIEDAGFIIHPTIFLWAFGSGFPKATNINKQIDKQAGVDLKKYAPITDLAKAWQGHRYGLQALKPAVEPIIIFQKPYEDRPLDNIIETGAGALNIDGTRIPLAGEDDEYVINTFDDGAKPFGNGAGHKYSSRKIKVPYANPENRNGVVGKNLGISNADKEKFNKAQEESIERLETMGRWPANFMLNEELADTFNNQTGIDVSKFFYNVDYNINQSDPVFYCAKVSNKERNAGLEELEDTISGMSNGAQIHGEGYDKGQDIGLNRVIARKNPHPTLKPIALTQWLATLLLPPEDYAPRKLLVPFSGAGSEMIGAMLAGWDMILGIEGEKKYIDIAEKRIEFYKGLS